MKYKDRAIGTISETASWNTLRRVPWSRSETTVVPWNRSNHAVIARGIVSNAASTRDGTAMTIASSTADAIAKNRVSDFASSI
jgi:hypothetical protein